LGRGGLRRASERRPVRRQVGADLCFLRARTCRCPAAATSDASGRHISLPQHLAQNGRERGIREATKERVNACPFHGAPFTMPGRGTGAFRASLAPLGPASCPSPAIRLALLTLCEIVIAVSFDKPIAPDYRLSLRIIRAFITSHVFNTGPAACITFSAVALPGMSSMGPVTLSGTNPSSPTSPFAPFFSAPRRQQ
jgi:hypothetical protein